MSLEAYCRTFYGFFFNIYTVIVIILIGATFLLKEKKARESYNFLYVFNTIFAWLSLIVFMFYVVGLFLSWYGQNPYEWYAFKSTSTNFGWMEFYLGYFLTTITPFIFFIRKTRVSRKFTIAVVIITHANFLLAYVQNFFRDYQPAAWSTYYEDPWIEKIAKTFFLLIFFAVFYWFANKRKKLPYPSLILNNGV
ncbi:hypothetical protein BH11BAC5_BH11BAC5_22800 [soil metagenome]